MVKKLTNKQELIFDYIKNSIRDSGFPPTVREIGECFEITVKGAYDHLKAIEKKGYIRCGQNKSRAIEILIHHDNEQNHDTIAIPIVGGIAAGAPVVAEENIEEYMSFPKNAFSTGVHFGLRVRGDSMVDAGIFDGDLAVIHQQPVANNGDIVAALVEDEATLKIFRKEADHIALIPANNMYQPILVDSVDILGKLAAVFRKY